jgi:hypothetical protein
LDVAYSGERPLEGLVLRAAAGLELTGRGGECIKTQPDGALVLPTLEPGARLRFRTSREGRQVIAPTSERPIAPRERRRIEYRNYAGLIRGAMQR